VVQIFLVHPGIPFWARKDEGVWSIRKRKPGEGEDALTAAKREYSEETGCNLSGSLHPLSPLKQPSGKIVSAWVVEGDFDAANIKSNVFSLEWPPHSGKMQEFPEVDRGAWFDPATARKKLLRGQRDFLDQLQKLLTQHQPAQ
jgi:predicted NUDIX family NTP pyrophosphohydrolase